MAAISQGTLLRTVGAWKLGHIQGPSSSITMRPVSNPGCQGKLCDSAIVGVTLFLSHRSTTHCKAWRDCSESKMILVGASVLSTMSPPKSHRKGYQRRRLVETKKPYC